MNDGTVNRYAAEADKRERDPFGPDGRGRAVVVNGRGFQWQRFHRDEKLVPISTPAGKVVHLTPVQHRVYLLCVEAFDSTIKMRGLATTLKVSPSTVSRAMARLMALGLIVYLTGRGRSALTFVLPSKVGDGFDRLRRAAKDRLRRYAQAAERRISRLRENVAPYALEGRGIDSLYWYFSTSTPRAQHLASAWTPQEIEDALR